MSKDEIIVGRTHSTWRIGAYECEVDLSRNPVRIVSRPKTKQPVAGWYKIFTLNRLQQEIMPKLKEYVDQGNIYPFLIVTYQLENKSKVTLPEDKSRKATTKDIKFSPRERRSRPEWVAVVYSESEYKILPDNYLQTKTGGAV